MKKNINKILAFLAIILIIVSFVISLIYIPLLPSDELWNFQNVFKMYNGFKIYNDSNVIVTPLFFYIEFIIFKILSANFFTFRITNLLIILPYFFFIYKILKNLKVKKCVSLIILSIMFYNTFLFLVSNGPNYNILAFLFFTIGLYYYTSNKNSNFIQGFIAFLIFFTKQTTGMFYVLAILIYELYKYKFSKTFFKNQFEKLITFIIPSVIIILILCFNGSLKNFINYTFGGLLDFSNNFIFSAKIYYTFIIAITYILSISIFVSKKNLIKLNFSKDFFDTLTLLIIFSSCALLILYPIFNTAHILMALPFFFIILAYIFNTIFLDFFENISIQTIMYGISTIILFILLLNNIKDIIMPYKKVDASFISDKNSPFFGTFLFDENIKLIDTLNNYISFRNENGIDVIICSYKSAYIMIPQKQSHGAYDLIFYGNLGYNGIEKMKQDILSRENTEFLVINNEDYGTEQFVLEIQDFIKENLTKCGEILNFDVYSK